MKALVYADWDVLEVQEVPQPICDTGEALIRVEACGICGSELEAFERRSKRRKPPLILGHEFCGLIESVKGDGQGGSSVKIGQKVVVNSVVPCGGCHPCLRGDPHLCRHRQVFGMNRPGALAELVAAPLGSIYPRPKTLDPLLGSLTEPLAVGVHMLRLLPKNGSPRIAIIGAGTIGLLILQAARALLDAEILVADLREKCLGEAERLGAEIAVNPQQEDLEKCCRDFSRADGVDFCIDAVGTSLTRTQSLRVLRPGGGAGWLGTRANDLSLESYQVILPERKIFGSYGAGREDFLTAMELLASGKVERGDWVRIYPLEDSVTAFQEMMAGSLIKAVITPGRK